MIKKYGVNSKKNCFSEIYYYSFYTDYIIDKGKMNLDDLEKKLSDYITVKKYYDVLFQFLNNNNINYKIFDK